MNSNRRTIRHPTQKLSLAYGNDHAVGWFVQVWDTSEYSEPDADNIIVDKDEMFNHIGIADIATVALKYGFNTADIV